MLDIGLSELLVIGGVALVVLGPEKLAVVARSTGKWTSKAQRYVNDVKADIAREGELAELRKLKEEMETTGREIGSSFRQMEVGVQHDLTALEASVKNTTDIINDDKVNDYKAGNANDTVSSIADNVMPLSDEQASASIQASLDTLGASVASADLAPKVDMTGKYQSGLDATLSPPPLYDPWEQRMAFEALQDDLNRLESQMLELKRSVVTAIAHTDAATKASS